MYVFILLSYTCMHLYCYHTHMYAYILLSYTCMHLYCYHTHCIHLYLGIPQGSVIATVINNLHYGSIERKHLNDFLNSPDCLLMRWVDDYLFVTTSRKTAKCFLQKLREAIAIYGSTINLNKVVLNFDMKLDGLR